MERYRVTAVSGARVSCRSSEFTRPHNTHCVSSSSIWTTRISGSTYKRTRMSGGGNSYVFFLMSATLYVHVSRLAVANRAWCGISAQQGYHPQEPQDGEPSPYPYSVHVLTFYVLLDKYSRRCTWARPHWRSRDGLSPAHPRAGRSSTLRVGGHTSYRGH